MLLDEKQKPWVTMFAILTIVIVAVYFIDKPRHLTGPSGSTAVGLTYGIIGYALMWFCAFLGLKRRVPHWRLGRAQTWLRGHVWFGLLVAVLVAFHTGFRAMDWIGWTLWVFLGVVTISGLVGIYIQQTVPRILLHGLHALPSMNAESPAQQNKELMEDCFKQAEARVIQFAGSLDKPAPEMPPEALIAAAAPAPAPAAPAAKPAVPAAAPAAPAGVVAAATPKPPASASAAPTPPAAAAAGAPATPAAPKPPAPPAAPAAAATAVAAPPKPAAPAPAAAAKPAAPKIGPPMGGEPVRRFWLDMGASFWRGEGASPLSNPSAAASIFGALKTVTPAHIHPGIDDLEELAARRRQLERQRRWMRVLHGWLLFHVPTSWGFIVLVGVHAVKALMYWGPFAK